MWGTQNLTILWASKVCYRESFTFYQSIASELSDCALNSPQQIKYGHAVYQNPASIFTVNPRDGGSISSKTLVFTCNTTCCHNPEDHCLSICCVKTSSLASHILTFAEILQLFLVTMKCGVEREHLKERDV
jgi:hypothetical protein